MQQGNPSLPLSFRYSRGVVEMFSERARQMPDSVALHDDAGSWTFKGVASVSDGMGERLAADGARGSAIGIYSSRHAALVPTLLGIWKAGAAAVILDSSYPPARLASQAAAVGLQGLICLEAAGWVPNALETLPVKFRLTMPTLEAAAMADFAGSRSGALAAPAADDTAYILFTSGTTGQPKAIATPHSALPHFLDWYAKTFRPTPADRFSMLSGLSHDPLMRDVFVPLTSGATLHIPKPDLLKLPRMLLQWLRAKQITYSHLTPSMGRLLTRVVQAGGQPLPDLRYAVFGGEPLRYSDAREFRMTAPHTAIVNCYGASETPQIMAFHLIGPADEIRPDGLAPVGEAIDDVQILILDEKRNPVPGDREGEIAIRTRYLSKGYLNFPTMTAERFIPNPFAAGSDPDDRIYLTGDRGRRIADSGIVYSGRSDLQVKIRGFRVELEEVEIALKNCPAVIDAAAAIDSEQADPQLYAFVQTHPGFDRSDCRKRLAATLPQYMAPGGHLRGGRYPPDPERQGGSRPPARRAQMSSRRADGATMVRFLHKLSPRELKRTCRNAAIDLQYGGFSGGYIRNPAPGAHGTGATDYDIMPQLFAGRIRPGDVLVDVGCGKGRVINWWLSQGHQNRIYGLELLPEIAEFTRKRLRKFRNVSIVTGDAIENLPSDGDVFFLFNPFDDRIMPGFIERLWGVAERRDITIVYFAPVYLHLFHSDTRWSVEELDVQLPKAGLFDPRHRRFAVIRPARSRERLKSR